MRALVEHVHLVAFLAGSWHSAHHEAPEYFNLRPETEKAYGCTRAIRIGDDIKISGAVSMDDAGRPTTVGDPDQQMRSCYADLDQVLKHYGCTFDDLVVENIFTTNRAAFLERSGYRSEIYAKRFPTGSRFEVNGLALPEFLIEIEREVHVGKPRDRVPAAATGRVGGQPTAPDSRGNPGWDR